MKGGLFFKFILGCWHNLTTLSISFHVFSIVLRSITNFGVAIASENAPWRRLNIEEIFIACIFLQRLLTAIFITSLLPPSSLCSISSSGKPPFHSHFVNEYYSMNYCFFYLSVLCFCNFAIVLIHYITVRSFRKIHSKYEKIIFWCIVYNFR